MVVGTPPQSATRTLCLGITRLRNPGTQPEAAPGLVSVAVGCGGSSTEDSRAQATVFLPDSSISAPNTHTHVRTQSRTFTLSFTYTPTLTYLCANTCTHTHADAHSFTYVTLTLTYRHTS